MDNNVDPRVLASVYAAIDEFNLSQDDGRRLEKNPSTVLLGANSTLDSLGLVNLLVTVEEQVSTQLNAPVTLASDKAFSMRNSPFATISSLTAYVQQLVSEASNG
jgi:acyl carrier protein